MRAIPPLSPWERGFGVRAFAPRNSETLRATPGIPEIRVFSGKSPLKSLTNGDLVMRFTAPVSEHSEAFIELLR
jgi:hypothetical protein